ncbi:MAG TPA: hypothetical protein VFY90_12755 [Tepidiformaceae bacterium]|nr:hypothetical protein [Tepidiformaceae bacterium]
MEPDLFDRKDPEGHRFDSQPEAELIAEVLDEETWDLPRMVEWQEKLRALSRRDSVAAAEAAMSVVRYPRDEQARARGVMVLQSLVPSGSRVRESARAYFIEWLRTEPDAVHGQLPNVMAAIGLDESTWLGDRLESPDSQTRWLALSGISQAMAARARSGLLGIDPTYDVENDPALGQLLTATSDYDDWVRLGAASILATFATCRRPAPLIRDALLRLAEDRNESIRAQAIGGLCQMHERDLTERLRSDLEAVLTGPDRLWEGHRLGPEHLLPLAEAVDALGDLRLMPVMEAIDERWYINDQNYLDGYGLRWRFTAADVDKMFTGLISDDEVGRWRALNSLSVFDPRGAVAKIEAELLRPLQPSEELMMYLCEAISRLRPRVLVGPLRRVLAEVRGASPPTDPRFVGDIEHMIRLCESSPSASGP